MNRFEVLHETTDLAVRRFDHPPHETHHDPDHEVAERWAIAFVRSGHFDVIANGVRHPLTAGSVFITRPGLAFRCQHAEQCPTDVCISVGFDDRLDAAAPDLWDATSWVARPTASPRLAYVDRRLQQAVDRADQFEVERWALGAVAALQADRPHPGRRGPYAARPRELDAVVASCRAIEADPTVRRSIADRAREVGLTSAALSQAFRRYVGVTPHQHVLRWRLAAAADLLDSGVSVSDACYRSGFENLSHFCRAFQRTFASRASQWRTLPAREKRRKVQDKRTSHF